MSRTKEALTHAQMCRLFIMERARLDHTVSLAEDYMNRVADFGESYWNSFLEPADAVTDFLIWIYEMFDSHTGEDGKEH